eukprot:1477031-Rhodomonas_salina.2
MFWLFASDRSNARRNGLLSTTMLCIKSNLVPQPLKGLRAYCYCAESKGFRMANACLTACP